MAFPSSVHLLRPAEMVKRPAGHVHPPAARFAALLFAGLTWSAGELLRGVRLVDLLRGIRLAGLHLAWLGLLEDRDPDLQHAVAVASLDGVGVQVLRQADPAREGAHRALAH